jgi:hypothetical protein
MARRVTQTATCESTIDALILVNLHFQAWPWNGLATWRDFTHVMAAR